LEQSLRLLVADSDLASAIDDAKRRRAALRELTAGSVDLTPGDHLGGDELAPPATLGAVVLSGFLVREWITARRASADLIGPGDVVQVEVAEPMAAMLHQTAAWTALTAARLALLDGAFFARAADWPEIAGALLERAGRLGQRLSLRGAIAALPTVDARLLASFWLWASQWGAVAGQGVVLRVPLSHERLARLIQARRPTITTAIGRLRRAGLISQRRDGSWVLRRPDPAGGEQSSHDLAMPVIDELLAYGPAVRGVGGPTSGGDSAARELRARFAEQREALRGAGNRAELEAAAEELRATVEELATTLEELPGSARAVSQET
jgi:CRP/FNR family transcriptional regulator, cyclic AMP receptor protein